MNNHKQAVEAENGSGLLSYAKEELSRLGEMDYDGMIQKAVLEIVGVFSGQGHSGGSAMMTLGMAERLMRFQPLSPLTGDDAEWTEVTEGTFQNKRCPSVFKEKGRPYDIGLPPKNGEWATIAFPYTPGKPASHEQTSSDISTLAGAYMHVTPAKLEERMQSEEGQEQLVADIRSLAASALTQDETKGQG